MQKSPFSSLEPLEADPIFSVAERAKAAGSKAINCTFGVLMDEDGSVSLLPSVRKAISDIAQGLPSQRFSYPPLLGLPAYTQAVRTLLFRKALPELSSIATTGGTGALAVNLRLMERLLKSKRMILPVPAWANHRPPADAANLTVVEVPYIQEGRATTQYLLKALEKEQGDVGLLLQVGSHNPTGLDLSQADWQTLIDALKSRTCVTLLDSAYQGLKDGVEEDVSLIHRFIDAGIPTLITWSAAKNHTIYGLRAGMALAVVPGKKEKAVIDIHYSRITRQLHSAAATIGQMVVARTQEAYHEEWKKDLHDARANIQKKRKALVSLLPERFHASLQGFGMFAMLPLSPVQVRHLEQEHAVFMTEDGRINIVGIPDARMEEFCTKVASV